MTYNDDPFKSPSEPFRTDTYGRDDYGAREFRELKHSGLGIASFAVCIVAGLIEFAAVAAAGVIEVSTPGGMDENSPVAILIGLALLGGLAIAMLGMGLGIAGLLQRRKKAFAVLGVIGGIVVVCGVGSLFAIGMMAE